MPITLNQRPALQTPVYATVAGQRVLAIYDRDYRGSAFVRYNGGCFLRSWDKLDLADTQVVVSTPLVQAAPAVIENDKVNDEICSVRERFEFTDMLCDSLVEGNVNSLLLTGSPGMGKTHSVITGMKRHDLGSADTVTHKGFVTPRGLYELLYHSNGKIIIFDDCDSAFDHEISANVLKAALDTYNVRKVSWCSSKTSSKVPDEFEFTGRMIAISNKNISQIPEAFTSRSVYVDLTMTAEEKIERIHQIGDKLCPDLNTSQVAECIDLLDRHKTRIKALNLRTMQMVGKLRMAQPQQWAKLATYMILTR
jgi:hypothetical protein